MSEFPTKTFTVVPSGHTYQYIRIAATPPNKSTIAFFHGFPAVAFGWHHQIKYFASKGHGIIAPDLLGYGGTSKPDSVLEYRCRDMVKGVVAILVHEKIDKFHGVSHDSGTYVLSRLYNYHPTRLLSLTFISVPYVAPPSNFDLQAINQMTKKLIGFEKFGYCEFLASEDSPELIEKHLASFQCIAYHSNVDTKADNFYPPGKLEAWLKADRNDKAILLDTTEEQVWLAAFRKGGFRGPTNWYRTMMQNVNVESEQTDLDKGLMTVKINVPVLAIDAQPDKASFPGFLDGSIKPHATADFTFETVQSQGHYPHIVSKDEVNDLILKLISKIDS